MAPLFSDLKEGCKCTCTNVYVHCLHPPRSYTGGIGFLRHVTLARLVGQLLHKSQDFKVPRPLPQSWACAVDVENVSAFKPEDLAPLLCHPLDLGAHIFRLRGLPKSDAQAPIDLAEQPEESCQHDT